MENKINCLPVSNDGTLVGIATSDDLLAALVYAIDPEYLQARKLEQG